MNDILKEHLAIKLPSTSTAREMLHIGEHPAELTNYDLNYAGNTYLIALAELAAQSAEIVRLREALESLQYYVGNPSAWDEYDDGVSEIIRKACEVAEPKFWMKARGKK